MKLENSEKEVDPVIAFRMNDLLFCRSCNVPPHFNCISFKECPYESVDCNFRATRGALCLCLLITKGTLRFNGGRVVLLCVM